MLTQIYMYVAIWLHQAPKEKPKYQLYKKNFQNI